MHKAFDSKGAEAAKALGVKLGLKEGTLKSWFGFWARAAKSSAQKKTEKAA